MVFRVVKVEQPDFIIAHHVAMGGIDFTQPWTRCVARKYSECGISGVEIEPGDAVFRPVTNARNRMYRVLASEVDKLTGFDLWYSELEIVAASKAVSVADRDAWFEPFQKGLSPEAAINEEYSNN